MPSFLEQFLKPLQPLFLNATTGIPENPQVQNFVKNVGQGVLQTIPKFAVSTGEAIAQPFTSGAQPLNTQYKLPLAGKFQSFQSEAGQALNQGAKPFGWKSYISPAIGTVGSGLTTLGALKGVTNLGNQLFIDNPSNPTAEQFIEKAGGWKPGMRGKFDEALYSKNAEEVKRLLPDVPPAYQAKFANEIFDTIGEKDAIRIFRGEGSSYQMSRSPELSNIGGEATYVSRTPDMAQQFGNVKQGILNLQEKDIMKVGTTTQYENIVKEAIKKFPSLNTYLSIPKYILSKGYKAAEFIFDPLGGIAVYNKALLNFLK